MSVKLIKTLGVQFCKMDPASLSDEALLKKKRKVTAIGDGGNLMDPNLEADEAEVKRTTQEQQRTLGKMMN